MGGRKGGELNWLGGTCESAGILPLVMLSQDETMAGFNVASPAGAAPQWAMTLQFCWLLPGTTSHTEACKGCVANSTRMDKSRYFITLYLHFARLAVYRDE